MPILHPNLDKEVKAYIAKECYRILKAVEQGGKIKHNAGLCANAQVDEELGIRFDSIFIQLFPFNKHRLDYYHEMDTSSIFQNKKRMAFLRRWAKKHKN